MQKPKLTREGKYILSSWGEFTRQHRRRREEMVRVSETFGFVANIYEKLRSAVEYKGEHVLRRAAIERMLKRILWLPKSDQEKAERLVRELVWSRFLDNESLPKRQLREIEKIISKYMFWLTETRVSEEIFADVDWREWLVGVASTEIEELLVPSYLRTQMSPLMFAWLKSHFDWDTETLSEKDREIQLFIASQRALAKSDQPILRYRLLLLMIPQWKTDNREIWAEIGSQFSELIKSIEDMLNYSQSNLVFRFVKKYTPAFVVLNEMLESPGKVESWLIEEPHRLEHLARSIIERKYIKLQNQVRVAVLRSIIYLFVTKVLVAMIIEIPYELWVLDHLNYTSLGINILIPPLLMLGIGISVRGPGEDNTKRIIESVENLLYQSEDEVKPEKARLTLTGRQKQLSRYFSLFYAVIFLAIVFGVGLVLLRSLHFNLVSTALFFMFLSLVLLFGYRVRWESQELNMAKPSGGVFGHVANILTLPFVNLGAWLSAGLSQINIFMFILDVVIDAPLKTLVGGVEEWSQFLQRKEEEVVEVPE